MVRDDIRRLVDDNLSALRSATKTRLKSGRANVMKLLTNTLPLTSGLPAPLRREAMITLIAKRHLIKGGTDLELIRISASGEAQKLLNRAGR